MDKKSANGFSSKPSESGGQRKQLPYSVETPYGFHLDLDFLKYVDDIEKGNTIKRVHIHRRAKGPKFSTLPRNFSLPGHGARPAPKDSWSGTATLGPKPKSRLAEVQQIYDFRPGDGEATSSQTQNQGKAPGGVVASAKPREEASVGSRVFEEKPLELQGRPNLLRASSMPITVQHRKGSDSGSPDRVVGTPENGSSENVFRATDATDRRSVPQDRIGLHQQITVALKRVRELEEQVRTIPELKAQICSLREEREQLILRLQAQVKAQAQAQAQAKAQSASSSQSQSSDPGTHTEPPGTVGAQGASREQSSAEPGAASDRLSEQHQAGLEPSALAGSSAPEVVKELNGESVRSSTAEEGKPSAGGQEIPAQPSQKSDQHRDLRSEKNVEHTAEQPSNDVTGESSLHTIVSEVSVELAESASTRRIEAGSTSAKDASLASCAVDNEGPGSVQQLQAELKSLEVKLIGACQELEDTNTQLKEQVAENRLKEERIQELSGDAGAAAACPEPGRKRRESVDRETETENSSTVDQGTDTEQIVVCVVRPRANSIDRGTETERVDTVDRVTETRGAEMECAARPRANSVDRETETERVDTVDQVTETPAPETVDRVTETVPVGAGRAQADIVDQGTETESVARVDRVTETVRVRSSDQQTETERNRRGSDNNPASGRVEEVGTRHPRGGANIEIVVTGSEVVEEEEEVRESGITEIFVTEARFEDDRVEVIDGASEDVAKEREVVSEKAIVAVAASEVTEPEASAELTAAESVVTTAILTETVVRESTGVESMEEVSCMVTQRVVKESSTTNTEAIPVRPQRGRRASPDQPQAPTPLQAPASPEPQAPAPAPAPALAPAPAPVPLQAQEPPQRPRRGSREPQLQPSEPQTLPQSQASPQSPQGAGEAQVRAEAPLAHQAPIQATGETDTQQPLAESKQHPQPQAHPQAQPVPESHGQNQAQPEIKAQAQPELEAQTQPEMKTQTQPELEAQTQSEMKTQTQPEMKAQTQPEAKAQHQLAEAQTVVQQAEPVLLTQQEAQPEPQPEPQAKQSEPKPQRPGPKTRRDSKEMKTSRRDSKEIQTPRRGSGESQAQAQSRRGSRESQSQPPRRGSKDTPQPDSSDGQAPRRGSSESPTSPAALGQVVTRLTGLLGEQWAQLGSGAGAQQQQQQQQQQGAGQQESSNVQKAAPAKRAASAAGAKSTTKSPGGGKPTGKAGPSKMSSIQSQLVSSLSVLSAFYSPGQKAAANKQQGLKSIMKKNDRADKQGNGGAKKNLKFVGVNGGYETTSSEDSSGDEKAPEAEEEEVDSSEPEELQEERPVEPLEPAAQGEAGQAGAQGGATVAGEQESQEDPQEPGTSEDLLEYKPTGGLVNKDFMEACLYVKDRMEEVSSPDKDMRKVLLVLYQEWFRVSSQKDSQADTVTLYLREVGLATPTLLRYIVNLTDGNGNTALHYSVSHSNFPVVKLLLDTGLCETDSQNKAGYTAVMLASLTAADSSEDLEVALQLLKQGHVNARASQAGQTALMLAVSHGRTAMVRLLLSCQADPNLQDLDGSTALMGACDHGHAEIVRLLLDAGHCDTGLTDKNGQTALTIATQASHGEIVDLLKAYADAMQASDPPTTASL